MTSLASPNRHHRSQRRPLFDNITFIDGNSDYGEIVALHIAASGTHEVSDRHFPWFDTHFASAFAALGK